MRRQIEAIEFHMDGITMMINCIHTGQYRPYGDHYAVFEIMTECQDQNIVVEAMKINFKYDVPPKDKWNFHDAAEYFRGYYTIEKIDGGFKYTLCEPYTD